MSLDVLRACVDGYSDRLLDQRLLALQTGYWAAYYFSKNPKSVESMSEKLIKEHTGTNKQEATFKRADTVDVETFLAREAAFKSRLVAANLH